MRLIAPALARFPRRPVAVIAGLVVLLLTLPYALRLVVFPRTAAGEIRAATYLSLFATCLIFAIAALGFAILVGYTGLLSLGHGNFLIFGGYAMAVVARRDGGNPWLTFIVVIVVSAAVGALLGLPACHVRGFYFTVMTLIFLPIGFIGSDIIVRRLGGIAGRRPGGGRLVGGRSTAFGYRTGRLDPSGRIGNRAAFYLIVVLFFLAVVVFVAALVRSRYGRAFQAIRESEVAARAAGISAYRYKVYAVMLSAAVVGVAGALYAQDPQFGNRGSVPSGLLDQSHSFLLVAMNVVGGLGTVAGPVIGAVALRLVPDLVFGTSGARDLQALLVGVSTLVAAVVAPWGVVGLVHEVGRRRERRRVRVGPSIVRRLEERRAPAVAIERARRRYRIVDHPHGPVRSDGHASTAPAWPPRGATVSGGSLELRRLSRVFGGLAALGGIDVTVLPGTVHAVIGPNGSGKTTLLNCVSGFYRPSAGAIRLSGRDVTGLAAHQRATRGIARTFQTSQVWPRLSVLDNVLIGGHRLTRSDLASAVLRLPWARREEARLREQARSALAFVGLDHRAGHAAGSLPFVDQRRLEIAGGLCADPCVLLLDEPAAGMSAIDVAGLVSLIRGIGQAGVTVVLVEHHMDVVMKVADIVTVLDYGRVIAEGPPREVATDSRVIEAYLGA